MYRPSTVIPFTKEAYQEWLTRNCHGCKKWNKTTMGNCEIDEALAVADAGTGHVMDEIANRAGLPGPCTEKQEKKR